MIASQVNVSPRLRPNPGSVATTSRCSFHVVPLRPVKSVQVDLIEDAACR